MSIRLISKAISRSGTTITQKMINDQPGVAFTNELHTYHRAHMKRSALEFYQYIHERAVKKAKYCAVPNTFNPEGFVERCMDMTPEDTYSARIAAVEKEIFQDKFKVIGDKGFNWQAWKSLLQLDFKFIFIIRDGRDVASSAVKNQIPKKSTPYTASLGWSENYKRWEQEKPSLKPENFIEIRFEDWVDNPDKNIKLICNLVGFNEGEFKQSYKNLFKTNNAHIGRYKKDIPNWEKLFHPETIKLLGELGYGYEDSISGSRS